MKIISAPMMNWSSHSGELEQDTQSEQGQVSQITQSSTEPVQSSSSPSDIMSSRFFSCCSCHFFLIELLKRLPETYLYGARILHRFNNVLKHIVSCTSAPVRDPPREHACRVVHAATTLKALQGNFKLCSVPLSRGRPKGDKRSAIGLKGKSKKKVRFVEEPKRQYEPLPTAERLSDLSSQPEDTEQAVTSIPDHVAQPTTQHVQSPSSSGCMSGMYVQCTY